MPDTLVVNVQGDEPMIEPGVIDRAVAAAPARRCRNCHADDETGSDAGGIDDPNRVKVVADRNGFALYFSRSPIPSR